MTRWILAFALGLGAGCALADSARVSSVQAPAWLERGKQVHALTAGTALMPQDRIRTGAQARVELKLSDGSTVKLGEEAQFRLDSLGGKPGLFRASLNVIQGAFRFTTAAIARSTRRHVTIQVATVTAGIRGTDLWGKSSADKDLVCLIEGKIAVSKAGHEAQNLDTPMAFYVAPRDGSAPTVASVSPEQLAQWGAETEIPADGSATRQDGVWKVYLGGYAQRAVARALAKEVASAGYATEIVTRNQDRRPIHLVRIPRLVSEDGARRLADSLRGKFEGTDVQISDR